MNSVETHNLNAPGFNHCAYKLKTGFQKLALNSNLYRYNRVLLHAASPFDAARFQRLLFRMEFQGEPVIGTPLLDSHY